MNDNFISTLYGVPLDLLPDDISAEYLGRVASMLREMELVKEILQIIREKANGKNLITIEVPGYERETIDYHLGLLDKAGLIVATSQYADDKVEWTVSNLTWEGHDFLDAINSEKIFSKAIETSLSMFGTVSIETIKTVIPIVIKAIAAQAGINLP